MNELDQNLSHPIELHSLGGFVLAILYGLPRHTEDLDYISIVPLEDAEAIQAIAGPDSSLARKYKVNVQYVTIADYPDDYATRLKEMFPNRFRKLRILALDLHDIVLSKLTRNHPVDDADVQFLAKVGVLDPALLRERYERELRPNLANQDRHDLTLRLWLESYFRG